MRIGAISGRGCVAAAVLAILGATGQRLAAQGAARVNGPVEAAPAVSPEVAHMAPARGILRNLVGTWRFEIRFAGNFDGAPDASGARVVRTLFDDLRLEWTEQLDNSQVQGQGIIGFDPASDRFFSTSVYNSGPTPELMTGVLDSSEPLITFSPIPVSPGSSDGEKLAQASALTMLDRNHFTLAALDRAWRALFTRQE